MTKDYAPEGKHLISVNILKPGTFAPEQIIEELGSWKIFKTTKLNHLKTYFIEYAQPDHFHMDEKSNQLSDKIIVAGDFMQTPSIEGAMLAGEKAAALIS